jgi:hypothetical protein
MSKPVIAIKLSPKSYSGLANLGQTIVAGMTANLNFTTPSPALAAVTIAVGDVTDGIAAWGPKGNRGSHAILVDLRNKALTLHDMLKAEAQYVQNAAQIAAGLDYPSMASIITSSGFQLANPRNPQGILQMVQNFHQFVSRKLNANQVKLKWKKPLNTQSAGNVKSYKVYRGTTPVFSAAQEIISTTRTTFTDNNHGAAPVTWTYWIVPVNAAGAGVSSDPLTVSVLNV